MAKVIKKPESKKPCYVVAQTPLRVMVYKKLDDLYNRAAENEKTDPDYNALFNEFVKFCLDVKKEVDAKLFSRKKRN